MFYRDWKWIFLGMVLLVVLCFSTPGMAQQSAGILRVGWGTDSSNLDPALQMGLVEGSVISHVIETLITLDPKDLSLKPLLAKKWVMLDDKTYQFFLQEGVTFHDGTPLDSEAVKYSLERFIAPETRSPRAFYLNMIDKIKGVNKYTVQITLKYPFAPFLQNISYYGGAIVSPKAAKELGLKNFGNQIVGTGPFKFKEWKRGEQIVLTRNENYWGKRSALKEIWLKVIPEESTRVIALETKAIDMAVDVPAQDADRLKANPDIYLATVDNLRTVYIGLNAKVKPFDDVRVRSAVNYATNVAEIVNALFGKYAVVANSVMNPKVFGGKGYPLKYDPAKAKELLAKAGFPNGFSTTMYTTLGRYPKDREIATLVASQLEQVGIRINLEVLEWAAYMSKLSSRNYAGMTLYGWGNPTGGPDTFLYPSFHSSQYQSNKNLAHYNNPEVDRLLDEARKTPNLEGQRKIYHRVMDIIQEDRPWIPIYYPVNIFGMRNYVKGFVPSPTEITVFDDVYMTQ